MNIDNELASAKVIKVIYRYIVVVVVVGLRDGYK